LNDLDVLADVIEGKVDKKHVFYQAHGDNDRDDGDGDRLFADEDEISYGGHVIDDDDQEQSDVDMAEDENVDDDNLDDCGIDDHDGDDDSADDNDIGDDDYYNGGGDDNAKEEEENDDNDVVDDEEDDVDEDEEEDDDEEEESNKSNIMCHYTPVAGEDIYGRSIPTSINKDDKSIYLPPAKRKQQQLLLQQQQMQQQSKSTIRNLNIDDDNEKTQLLRRQINGLMNKLSFQSKDTILRSLKQIFENNSIMICSIILKDTILLACSNTSQLMLTIIPIYATIIASLHCIVNIDIGAIIIEFLINCFYKSFHDICHDNDSNYDLSNNNNNNNINNDNNKTTLNHNGDTKKRLISSKLPANILLLLIYLYNLRIIYHTLIVDILKELTISQDVESSSSTSLSVSLPLSSSASSSSLSKHQMFLIETKVELIECILNHCGNSIRNDDPMSLKLIIQNFSKDYSYLLHSTSRYRNDDNNHENHSDGNADDNKKNDDDDDRNNVITVNSRLKFMFESLSDLKNNKSRRIQKANDENVKQLRKWLGNVKTVLKSNNNSNTESTCLRISLSDLLNADLKGRWWKTGDTCSYINIELKITNKTMLLNKILVKNVYMLIHHNRKRDKNIFNKYIHKYLHSIYLGCDA